MIRRRVVVTVSAVTAAAILVAGYAVLVVLERQLIDNLDRDFRRGALAQDIRAIVDRPPNRPAPGGPFAPDPDIAIVGYADGTGVAFSYASGRDQDPDPLPDAGELEPGTGIHTVEAIDGSMRYRAVALQPVAGVTVVVAMSLESVDETIADARRILVVIGIGALAAIAVVSWALIRRSLEPLEVMVATADRIAGGDLTERTGVADDGSEVGRLGSALDTMLDRIEEAVDAKTASEARMRRFVAEASHELRTPLTSVRGYAELYRKGETQPAQVAVGMQRIEDEATRMSALVEDLLRLARLDQDPAPREDDVRLDQLAGEAVDAARMVDGDRVYDLDLVDAAVSVRGDRDGLRRVLDNLLANARLHTPAGTTVTVRADRVDHRIRMVVEDDGPGLAAADRERAFDRFWRGTRADENPVEGSGLGLSIVRAIVHAHHGTVTLDERPGGGARFVIELPGADS